MKEKDDAQNWLLLALLTLIWGTSYFLIKKSLHTFPPLELGALRVSLTFIACIPFYPAALRAIPRNKYPHVLFAGVIGVGIPVFLFAYSQTHIDSAVSGIINSLSPLFTVLTGIVFWQISAPRVKLLGVLIGLAGAVILVYGNGNLHINGDIAYTIMPVIATILYGTNSNFVKRNFADTNPLHVITLSIGFIGLPYIVLLFTTDFVPRMHHAENWRGFGYACILAVFGTLVGWLIFYRLIQRRDALFAASVTYLVPIVAISWGLSDGEVLNAYHAVGLLLILVGVYFVSRQGEVKGSNQKVSVSSQKQ